jgi:microcystin-dependent protein
MHISLHIEADVPRWIKRVGLVVVLAIPVVLGYTALADPVTVFNTFAAGDILTAAKLNANFEALATPPGTVVAFAGPTAPSGWLLCDGSAVSRTTYASLFGVVGVTYGIGDAINTFNLPDLRAAGIRGVGTSTQFTANATVALGEVINDQLQGHYHRFFLNGYESEVGTNRLSPDTLNQTDVTGYGNVKEPVGDGTNGTPRTGPETTGKAIGLNYLIKY